MIRVHLRDALGRRAKETGERLSLAQLSKRTGVSLHTLQSIAYRSGYNATLDTISKICIALDIQPSELLSLSREGDDG